MRRIEMLKLAAGARHEWPGPTPDLRGNRREKGRRRRNLTSRGWRRGRMCPISGCMRPCSGAPSHQHAAADPRAHGQIHQVVDISRPRPNDVPPAPRRSRRCRNRSGRRIARASMPTISMSLHPAFGVLPMKPYRGGRADPARRGQTRRRRWRASVPNARLLAEKSRTLRQRRVRIRGGKARLGVESCRSHRRWRTRIWCHRPRRHRTGETRRSSNSSAWVR